MEMLSLGMCSKHRQALLPPPRDRDQFSSAVLLTSRSCVLDCAVPQRQQASKAGVSALREPIPGRNSGNSQ